MSASTKSASSATSSKSTSHKTAAKKTATASSSNGAGSAEAESVQLPFTPQAPSRLFPDPHAVPPSALKEPPPPATIADVNEAYAKPAQQSPSNSLGDPTQNLQNFSLADLAVFTKEKTFSSASSKEVHLFYVGRDDVHELLKYVLSRVTISLYLNMFGFDDSELNQILMDKAMNPSITMLITLDASQANGVHEKALIAYDQKYNLAAFNTHFAIGESATHQISHTKGFVADGRVAAEGSTNWSASGEGTFKVQGQPGGPGYQAQNNTQSIITDPDTIVRFQTELIAEHMTVVAAAKAGRGKTSQPLPTQNTPAAQAIFDKVKALSSPGIPVKPTT